MTFGAVFPRVMRPAFGPGLAAASSAWWLSGGISAANAIAVYQPKGAASLAASYVNLANHGTYDAVPGVAPGWSAATGWSFDGATQWLRATITPTGSWSILVRFANCSGGGSATVGICGALGGDDLTGILWLNPRSTNSEHDYHNMSNRSSGALNVAGLLTAGVMGVAGANAYLDGAGEGAVTQTTQRNVTYVAFGAVYTVNYGAAWFLGCDMAAVAIYGSTLSAAQMAAVSAAMAAL